MKTHSTVTTNNQGSLKTFEKNLISLYKGWSSMTMLLLMALTAMSFSQADTTQYQTGHTPATADKHLCCMEMPMVKLHAVHPIYSNVQKFAHITSDAPAKSQWINRESIHYADKAMDASFRERTASRMLANRYRQQLQPVITAADEQLNTTFDQWTMAPAYMRKIDADALPVDADMDVMVNSKQWQVAFNKQMSTSLSHADFQIDRQYIINTLGVKLPTNLQEADAQMDALVQTRGKE